MEFDLWLLSEGWVRLPCSLYGPNPGYSWKEAWLPGSQLPSYRLHTEAATASVVGLALKWIMFSDQGLPSPDTPWIALSGSSDAWKVSKERAARAETAMPESLEKSLALGPSFKSEDYLEYRNRGQWECLPTKVIFSIHLFNTSCVPGTLNTASHWIFPTANSTR